jgi:hypothetical protein
VKQFRQNCLGGHQGQAELEKCINKSGAIDAGV